MMSLHSPNSCILMSSSHQCIFIIFLHKNIAQYREISAYLPHSRHHYLYLLVTHLISFISLEKVEQEEIMLLKILLISATILAINEAAPSKSQVESLLSVRQCEGTVCPGGCCPEVGWFCCPDGTYCASNADNCPYINKIMIEDDDEDDDDETTSWRMLFSN